MPAVKYSAKGAILKSGAAIHPTTTVGSLKSLVMDIGERTLLDTTTHDNSATKSYVDSGLKDTVSLDITVLADPGDTNHEALRAAHAAGTPWYLSVVTPDAGAALWEMLGIILNISVPAMNTDGLLEYTIKYKATAAETYTQ